MKPWALRRSWEHEHHGFMGHTVPGAREAGQGTPVGLSRRLNWAAAAGFNRKSCVQQTHGLLSLTLHRTSLCIYWTSLYTGHHSTSTGHHSPVLRALYSETLKTLSHYRI